MYLFDSFACLASVQRIIFTILLYCCVFLERDNAIPKNIFIFGSLEFIRGLLLCLRTGIDWIHSF